MIDSPESFRVTIYEQSLGLGCGLDPPTARTCVLEIGLLAKTVKFLGDPILQDVLVVLESFVTAN